MRKPTLKERQEAYRRAMLVLSLGWDEARRYLEREAAAKRP